MSLRGQGRVAEFLLPYVLIVGIWVMIKKREARNEKKTFPFTEFFLP